MKTALISDIHGNLAALKAVLAEIDAMGIGRVLCLGDMGGYYPDVDAVCDLLRARGIPALMGNHDWYLAKDVPCPRSNSANRCLDHQRATMRPDTLSWLQGLHPSAEWDGIQVVHGGWNDPLDEYLVPSKALFSALCSTLPGRVFASGHSHVALTWQDAELRYCNPGSVGQPRDGDWRAAFATWDGADFTLHRVPYDVAATEAAMAEAGFDAYFYENLRLGAQIGGKINQPAGRANP